jgi:hypothetical protein
MVEPAKCMCRRPTYVCEPLGDGYMAVFCPTAHCARGPYRKTERGAIKAWNRLRGYSHSCNKPLPPKGDDYDTD